ncbi:uncharacterized mitochondrial protein AtMg00810-like [Beta vulgaris subsp. vulgaris]|uniref:uncharacterized mitochondrial protein AtMg00810-like n=1 Tax=Beta vulgaris subsp. vulgaris TaxID=3555 RepID=UPI002036C721|nr:uncharacterized mitochondrial protein AtMg00810-like [Beta vulgaris subsp. vulgaris]
MHMPTGIPNPHNLVCRLNKSLYGLKQASRQWFQKLNSALLSQGFLQSKNDYSLFIKKESADITILVVYVDDIIITGTNLATIDSLKAYLHTTFSIKDLGKLHYFLGIEVLTTSDGFILSQHKFTKELLQDSGLTFQKKTSTPLPTHVKLLVDEGELYHDPAAYRSLVGKLNFLTHIRPDLAFAVQSLSQFMHSPKIAHYQALVHNLHYVNSTVGQGIFLKASDKLTLQAYCDSDWAARPNTRKSVTGYVLLLGTSPISWNSKKQGTTSKSSSEAEYRAMAQAASEVCWLVRLRTKLGISNLTPVTLHCDNMSALHIARNPVFHERTKHIEVDCHFTRDKVLEGLLQLSYLPTQNPLVDVFTKILPVAQHKNLLFKLGLVPSYLSIP